MAPQLVEVLRTKFFNTRSSMGYKYPELITRVTGITLSLVATVIWVALKQWESGELDKKVSMGSFEAYGTSESSF